MDVTIHEILDGGLIKEIHSATGGAWGGTYVDNKFHEMLKEIFGESVFEEFKKEFLADYMEIRKTLEIGKRNFSSASSHFEFRIPPSLKQKCKSANNCKFEDLIERSAYKNFLKCKREKLYIDVALMKDLFSTVCDSIVNHVKNLLKDNNINTVLMVGGFSESPFLQEKMKEALPDCHTVIPNEAGLAVLRGAVLFGHEPKAIVSRIAKYSYGVDTYTRFIPAVHPPEKIKIVNDKEYCSDVFSKHITIGDVLKIDEVQQKLSYSPIYPDQKSVRFNVFTSTSKDPKYVDDGSCQRLASLDIPIPDISGGTDRRVLVQFMFGETEIKVEGVDEKTGEVTEIKFNYFDTAPDDGKQFAMQE